MTVLLASSDTLAESQRLIALLEQCCSELPFAGDILAIHRPAHEHLEHSSMRSDAAVDEWRAALAQRWECEVAGRRLYKQVLRQLAEYYGGDSAPEVQLLSRGGAEVNSSPVELLHDLRRLQAALGTSLATPQFAPLRGEVDHICLALEDAIGAAQASEARRRDAALDKRLAREAYRRARAATERRLLEFFGGSIAGELAELFE
jgi:hypothetical protein